MSGLKKKEKEMLLFFSICEKKQRVTLSLVEDEVAGGAS